MSTEHKSNTPKEIKDLYQTPLSLFQSLDKEFNFNVDVAASSENSLVYSYFDEETNGLIYDWSRLTCWCNPPYSNIMPWVEKAAKESKKGATVVMLVPADPSVKWFKRAWETANEVRFINGRISFIGARTGLPVKGNNKGSVLIIWRPEPLFYANPTVKLISREDLINELAN